LSERLLGPNPVVELSLRRHAGGGAARSAGWGWWVNSSIAESPFVLPAANCLAGRRPHLREPLRHALRRRRMLPRAHRVLSPPPMNGTGIERSAQLGE
jgi:hypothetical protein